MKNYTVRRAVMSDLDDIMLFIDRYWSANHILAKNKTIFEWQYRDEDQLNFVIACENETKDILAVLGFVKYGRDLTEDIMLALWKSKSSINPFLGVELLEYLENALGANKISCNGINLKTTKVLYEFMGFRIDYLKHYYRLANQDEYQIASITNKYRLPCANHKEYELVPIECFEKLEEVFQLDYDKQQEVRPQKGLQYIEHRFFNHPVYQYKVYGIKDNCAKINSLLFMRAISCNHSKVLRIVDFIGNTEDLNYISYELEGLLEAGEYEYIDFLQNGIDYEIMEKAGFLLNDENSQNIIPNYFEPYECSNVKVWFCTKYGSNFIMCKADGDQDRPNKI